MLLIGRNKLERIGGDVDRWVCNWCSEVVHAHWHCPEDITDQFPNAHIHSEGNVLFPVGMSGYSIRLQVAFPQNIALILDMNKINVTHG